LLGNDHPHTLMSISMFARLLHAQGKLAEAEPLYRQALEARRRLLGNDHEETLESVNELAELLRDQGKPTEAQPLFQEAVEGFYQLVGDVNPETILSTINDMADRGLLK
jgi:eukaryotic-like serine/threonine-protein kinase